MSCTIRLLLDHRFTGLIEQNPLWSYFDMSYASPETMADMASTLDYDLFVLKDDRKHVHEALLDVLGGHERIVLLSDEPHLHEDPSRVIPLPSDPTDIIRSLPSIHGPDTFIMRCRLIRHLQTVLRSKSKDAGEQASRMPRLVRALCQSIINDHAHAFPVPRSFMQDVIMFSAIHDIGKIEIDDDILLYSGIYDDAMRAAMKEHAALGTQVYERYAVAFGTHVSVVASNIIRYHHERYDGTGYPIGLKGEEIPLEARIVGIADVFEALASKRVYKEKTPSDEIIRILMEGSGTHFDPHLSRIMLKDIDIFLNLVE
jgi:HD-GYP domain-containing protein (c-di-GMP phosphodiesterase class II)